MDALREHLIVEDEIVGIFQQRKVQQDFGAEGTVSRVVFGELDPQE